MTYIVALTFLLLSPVHPFTLNMVEGHSVHRVATLHRQRLVGKSFRATSPNGRFTDGARAIDGKMFYRIEAVGKNLFAFFRKAGSKDEQDSVVVHVHFGMAGAWAVYHGEGEPVPEPTATNRLRLQHETEALTADLSAMTVNYGGMALYEEKRSKLGQDPLRPDADPELLWKKVKASKKSIGALIMDQSFFTGPGNIYRAEILFKAGIHPDTPGLELEKHEFDLVWQHTVALLERGYQTGSILTVDEDEAKQLGKPKLRRYIYNSSNCPRCKTRIQTWTIASRTCYACPKCQPRYAKSEKGPRVVTPNKDECVPFNSHCARESVETRLSETGPSRLTVKEIRAQLAQLGVEDIPKNMKKAGLAELLLAEQAKKTAVAPVTVSSNITSSEEAAAEKAAAQESLAVEHIAELAPGQARRARAKATSNGSTKMVKEEASTEGTKAPPSKRKSLHTTANTVTPSPKKRRVSPRTKR